LRITVRIIALIMLGSSASGCASQMMWVKPGLTQVDFEHDKLECEYEARKSTQMPSAASVTMEGALVAGIEGGMRLVELQTLCMQARGYSQQRRQS
jgi:hypothetical protein